jgi:hypothetical protein
MMEVPAVRILLLLPIAALAACLPHPPPAPPPGEVIPQTADVALDRLPPAALAAYVGAYRGSGGTLVIRRTGADLYADRNGVATALKVVGLGTFSDAAGTAYLFLPADGRGGRLRTIAANGTTADWAK